MAFSKQITLVQKWHMKTFTLIVCIASSIAFSSCGKAPILECDKLQTEEEARDLIERIRGNSTTELDKIKDQLIGEWLSIGLVFGYGREFEPGLECITLKIDCNTIEIIDNNSGVIDKTEWDVLPSEVNGSSGYYLKTKYDAISNRIGMGTFSENIMYGQGRAEDTNTYIYEKVN